MKKTAGTIMYDGTCKFCQRFLIRLKKRDKQHRFEYVSSTNTSRLTQLHVTKKEAMKGIIYIDVHNKKFQEATAVEQIYVHMAPYHVFSWGRKIPLLRQLIDYTYKYIAKHRYKIYGRCNSECSIE